jgi:SSS family solute:Na+ symporter
MAATEFGVVTSMYAAQNGFEMGFAGATPGILLAAAMYFVGATGFCIEPLRAAGVMTIPELFEGRFGMRIRWASGVVIVLGGLLNMGVFLRTGGEFLVFASGLQPDYLEVTMTVMLVGVAVYTVLGGMLSVLITDYLQFVVMSAGLLLVTVLILVNVGWNQIVDAVSTHHGAGAAIVVGAVLPIAYLIAEQLPQTKELATRIGPYYSGIATYVFAGVAMVVGSLLKPSREQMTLNDGAA